MFGKFVLIAMKIEKSKKNNDLRDAHAKIAELDQALNHKNKYLAEQANLIESLRQEHKEQVEILNDTNEQLEKNQMILEVEVQELQSKLTFSQDNPRFIARRNSNQIRSNRNNNESDTRCTTQVIHSAGVDIKRANVSPSPLEQLGSGEK